MPDYARLVFLSAKPVVVFCGTARDAATWSEAFVTMDKAASITRALWPRVLRPVFVGTRAPALGRAGGPGGLETVALAGFGGHAGTSSTSRVLLDLVSRG